MRAIPGLSAFLDEWVKSWGNDGPLAKIGMVAMPADVMAASAAKVREQTVLTREELAAKK
jgi:phosphate transport system substrate-binding protein